MDKRQDENSDLCGPRNSPIYPKFRYTGGNFYCFVRLKRKTLSDINDSDISEFYSIGDAQFILEFDARSNTNTRLIDERTTFPGSSRDNGSFRPVGNQAALFTQTWPQRMITKSRANQQISSGRAH